MGHTRKALRALSNRGQHTAHLVLSTVDGEPQDDAISKPTANTVPAFLFFEGIRGTVGIAVKEGRGGVHRTSHRGCVSPAQLSLHAHQSEHVNMHMNRYIGTHMQTRAKVRTHCFKRWPIKNTTLLVVQQMERGTAQKSRLAWSECLRRQWWPNSYPLPVSLLCSRGVFAARMPDSRSCQGKQRHN